MNLKTTCINQFCHDCDAVEKEREDCVFLYITHDLEFARSRMQSQIIWVKEFEKENQWQYELLDDADASDGLKLEILGNRQKVLLVEGTRLEALIKTILKAVSRV